MPPLSIHADREQAARELAREIAELVRARPSAVLGLPTGTTPVALYRELARLHRGEGLSFRAVRTFNLDEYLGLAAGDPHSFRCWMQEQFFRHVDLRPEHCHLPACGVAREAAAAEAERYAGALARAGGLDLAVLGIGRNGHIGFNEPGSPRESRTRVVELDPTTIAGAAAAFGGIENVPRQAITLGIADILEARALRVLAFGTGKAEIVRRALEGPVGPELPASWLRGHADVRWHLDREAAAHVTPA